MKDLFSRMHELNKENIEKHAPESSGVIILYDKQGRIEHLAVANDSLKSTLYELIDRNSAALSRQGDYPEVFQPFLPDILPGHLICPV